MPVVANGVLCLLINCCMFKTQESYDVLEATFGADHPRDPSLKIPSAHIMEFGWSYDQMYGIVPSHFDMLPFHMGIMGHMAPPIINPGQQPPPVPVIPEAPGLDDEAIEWLLAVP